MIGDHSRPKSTGSGFGCASFAAAGAAAAVDDVGAAGDVEPVAAAAAVGQPADEVPDGTLGNARPSVPSSRSSSTRAGQLLRHPQTSYRSTCCSETPTDSGGTLDSTSNRSMSHYCYYCSDGIPSGSTRPRLLLPGVNWPATPQTGAS